MNYEGLTREELIAELTQKSVLLNQLLAEKEEYEGLNFSWTGNLGHWYWNVPQNQVKYNNLKINALGYTPEEVPENTQYQFFTDRIHPDDFDRVMDNMRSHLYGKTNVYEVEYRIRSKNNEWIWFYDRGKVTKRDADGKPLLLAGIVFDISEKKRAEEQQQKLIASLTELLKLKEKIFSIIFHDIKGPMGNVVSFSGLALSDIENIPREDLKKYLTIIKEVSEKTINTATYLMGWLKAQSAEDKLKPQAVYLQEFIDSMFEEEKVYAEKKNISLINNISEHTTIYLNKEILSVCLRNLLNNALKFTPRNGSIKIEFDEDALHVQDSGVGMDQSTIDNLAKNKTFSQPGTEDERGHGLGLLVVYDLIKSVDGELKFSSKPSQGTRVTIKLPANAILRN